MYFSDRELGPKPRVKEEFSKSAWGGIIAAIKSYIADGSFGYGYPLECQDGKGTYGCDEYSFSLALKAEILDISWPLIHDNVLATLAILDLIEFCYRAVGKPEEKEVKCFLGHSHFRFKVEEGRAKFRDDINCIFARNGLAYELRSDGSVVRLAPIVLRDALKSVVFQTGDHELDSLLEAAITKYLDPDSNIRKESLEKLWDAWERLKTIENEDKRKSVEILLKKVAAEPRFRKALDKEAHELSDIGNNFRIRHSETIQVPLEHREHVDYLFHRLFALIRLFLRTTGRGG
jgi:hypothetical protein